MSLDQPTHLIYYFLSSYWSWVHRNQNLYLLLAHTFLLKQIINLLSCSLSVPRFLS